MSAQPRRFLMTMWDGGGNAPPELGVARRAVERGHQVHVLGDPTLARAAEAAGCTFSSWTRAPHRATLDVADDLVKDWEANDPLETLRGLRDKLMSGPAAQFAADTTAVIEVFGPDAVIADTQMFGSVIAAEGAGLPVAVFVPNLWVIPIPGTGDRGVQRLITRVVNAGLPDLNAARAEYDLPPLMAFYDQILEADRILVLSSETFDPASTHVPENVRYVGPILDDPSWVEPWSSPWPEDNTDPLVLVGFSSVYQDQVALLQRVIDALSSMKVRAVVAAGLMFQASELVASPNVAVVQSAPHTEILKEAALVVSHCGHGTTMKTLAAGVPMVCIPMGRDQDATAAQVVLEGAGVELSPTASTDEIRAAIGDVLKNGDYKVQAARLADVLEREHQSADVVLELEQLLEPAPPDPE